MKSTALIFTGQMVKALLDGKKTQTRRLVKQQPTHLSPVKAYHRPNGDWAWVLAETGMGNGVTDDGFKSPYGVPGDRIWAITIKPVFGHENRYGVGDDGIVYRTDGPYPKALRGTRTPKGYLRVQLKQRGISQNALVHRLVCWAFYGQPLPWQNEVRHLDGDPANNRPENLDWGTAKDNCHDRHASGLGTGEGHPYAKLSAKEVEFIRSSKEGPRALGRKFGVNHSTISHIKSGKNWNAQIPAPLAPNNPRWNQRLFLEITDVRVQRLHEITEDDARAEGVWTLPNPHERGCTGIEKFADLWDSIHGPCAWNQNPWVWCYSFTKIEKPGEVGK